MARPSKKRGLNLVAMSPGSRLENQQKEGEKNMIHPIDDGGWEKLVGFVKNAGIMAKGAFWLIVIAYLVWLWQNFDVQIKAMRYPETIRKLDITVTAAQFTKN